VYQVERAHGEELWRVSERIPEQGWVAAAGTVLLEHAADYFSNVIRAKSSAKAHDKFKADSRARVDLYRAKKPYRITETP
jgi:hypothetical protein